MTFDTAPLEYCNHIQFTFMETKNVRLTFHSHDDSELPLKRSNNSRNATIDKCEETILTELVHGKRPPNGDLSDRQDEH